MGKIDFCFQILGHAFMVAELPAIIVGEGMHPIFVRGEGFFNSGSNGAGGFVKNGLNDRIERFTLNQRHQGAFVSLTDHGISFPVTETLSACDDRGTIVDGDLIGNYAAPVIGTIALAPHLLATQGAVQVSA